MRNAVAKCASKKIEPVCLVACVIFFSKSPGSSFFHVVVAFSWRCRCDFGVLLVLGLSARVCFGTKRSRCVQGDVTSPLLAKVNFCPQRGSERGVLRGFSSSVS